MDEQTLTEPEFEDLRCLAGLIIPASAKYNVPGADDDRIVSDIVGSIARDLGYVRTALSTLRALAGGSFAALDATRRAEVAAKLRAEGGVPVRVLLFCAPEDLTGDAATNQRIIARAGLLLRTFADKAIDTESLRNELSAAEWVVDALFGTGLSGPIREPLATVVNAINAGPARILAVDIPSGLDCDTGVPLGPTVRAQHTVTFVAAKRGTPATITEIAGSFDISKAHLMKVVNRLGKQGYLDTVRGKGGGIRLARAPADIRVGAIVRATEEELAVIGCLSTLGFRRIEGRCILRHALDGATRAFLQTLDGYTRPISWRRVGRCSPFEATT